METASFGATNFVDVVYTTSPVKLRCYGWLILYYPVWEFSSVMTKHPDVMPLSAGKKGKSEGRNHKPWFVGFLPLVCVWIG